MKFLATLAMAVAIAIPSLSPVAATRALADQSEELKQKKHWQTKYRTLVQEVDRVRARLESNRTEYRKARQRGRLRGGSGEEITSSIEADEAKLAELEQELADFPDAARRAGIPPGWLRDITPASAGE